MAQLSRLDGLKIIGPQGYLDFLSLLEGCRIVLTDSGGIQEESCIMGKSCVTLRENTERPETVDVGANIIAGIETRDVIDAMETMMARKNDWENPFGDGHAAERIVDKLIQYMQ